MILFELGLSKPIIKKYKNEYNTTFVMNLGLFKITWLNETLTQMFLKIAAMCLQDIELLSNFKEREIITTDSYELAITELTNMNNELEKNMDLLDTTNNELKMELVELTEQLTMDRKLLETYIQENVVKEVKPKKGRKKTA